MNKQTGMRIGSLRGANVHEFDSTLAGLPFGDVFSGPSNPPAPEQVADVANALAWKIWQRYPYSWKQKSHICEYYQQRNEASYASRKKIAKAKDREFL
ncbi:MAG: hypothetical protein IH624_12185 [Phycisphaerae bacterium]|nr:hypothetical protein [Phycisphaerae bacterium]